MLLSILSPHKRSERICGNRISTEVNTGSPLNVVGLFPRPHREIEGLNTVNELQPQSPNTSAATVLAPCS